MPLSSLSISENPGGVKEWSVCGGAVRTVHIFAMQTADSARYLQGFMITLLVGFSDTLF